MKHGFFLIFITSFFCGSNEALVKFKKSETTKSSKSMNDLFEETNKQLTSIQSNQNQPDLNLYIERLMQLWSYYTEALTWLEERKLPFSLERDCLACTVEETYQDHLNAITRAINQLSQGINNCLSKNTSDSQTIHCLIPVILNSYEKIMEYYEMALKSYQYHKKNNSQSPQNQFSSEQNHSSQEDYLRNYDSNLGQKIAQSAKQNHAGRSKGLCYTYVANAMERTGAWPRGFHDSGGSSTNLNHRTWASSFARYWHPEVHPQRIPYKAVYLKRNINGFQASDLTRAEEAPVGSILVWEKCNIGSSAAGHIAIVTQKGTESVSDFVHDVSTVCNMQNLIGIFIPVKR